MKHSHKHSGQSSQHTPRRKPSIKIQKLLKKLDTISEEKKDLQEEIEYLKFRIQDLTNSLSICNIKTFGN